MNGVEMLSDLLVERVKNITLADEVIVKPNINIGEMRTLSKHMKIRNMRIVQMKDWYKWPMDIHILKHYRHRRDINKEHSIHLSEININQALSPKAITKNI